MGRYQPISEYLNAQPSHELIIGFDKIEQIIRNKLPQSAFKHNAWWANNPSHHSHARAWTEIGWKTQDVDIEGKKVKFVKEKYTPSKNQISVTNNDDLKIKKSIFGALKGTVKINNDNFFEPIDIKWNAPNGNI